MQAKAVGSCSVERGMSGGEKQKVENGGKRMAALRVSIMSMQRQTGQGCSNMPVARRENCSSTVSRLHTTASSGLVIIN